MLVNEMTALHITHSTTHSGSSIPVSEKTVGTSGTTAHNARPEENESSQSPSAPNPPEAKHAIPQGILEKAIDTVKRAIDADNAMCYREAHDLYLQALQSFLVALKTERNPKSRDLIREKTAEYIGRAEQLQAHLRGKGTPSGKPATKSKSEDHDMSGFLDKSPPEVNWSDMRGVSHIQQTLLNAIILPAKFPQLFTGLRKATTRILLYGPPGTGKNTLVKALASEATRTLFRLNASELVRNIDREGAINMVEQLCTAARDHQPSIVQINNFHRLVSRTGRLFLQELERHSTNSNKKLVNEVILIGITTKPWDLELETRAIFQETVHIPIPDETGRRDILVKQIDRVRLGAGNCSKIECDAGLLRPETYTRLAKLTEGYSVRDIIEGVVKIALMAPVTKIQKASHWKKVPYFTRSPCPAT